MRRLERLAREDGFSLVELMVVVVIIGVLVSIATASYIVSVRASRDTACEADLKVVGQQVVVYRCKYGENPPTLQDLVPEFIEEESDLRCPASGEEYQYNPDSGEVSCPHHGGP